MIAKHILVLVPIFIFNSDSAFYNINYVPFCSYRMSLISARSISPDSTFKNLCDGKIVLK
jgi:hypothetical protein